MFRTQTKKSTCGAVSTLAWKAKSSTLDENTPMAALFAHQRSFLPTWWKVSPNSFSCNRLAFAVSSTRITTTPGSPPISLAPADAFAWEAVTKASGTPWSSLAAAGDRPEPPSDLKRSSAADGSLTSKPSRTGGTPGSSVNASVPAKRERPADVLMVRS